MRMAENLRKEMDAVKWKKGIVFACLFFMIISGVSISCYAAGGKKQAEKIRISAAKLKITKGQTKRFKIIGTKKKVKWKSSNRKVASVTKKSIVKGKRKGKAKITGMVGKRKLTCRVSVTGRMRRSWKNYLEQLFPFMGVRFISVNDNYNSAELADGTTGGLDVAFKNLIYDYYSREMSRKQRIAWQRMAEQGKYNSNCTLYGYRKSEEDKHKLVIEPEEAAVVKEIFDMKIAGTGTTLIAKTLNDRGIPCPSELYRSRGDTRRWKNRGKPCYWTAGKIEAIIRDEKYTGTMVQLKTKLDSVGGKQVSRPKEEWVRVENTHEPVITYPQYIRAVSSLKQQKAAESRKMKNIYYCGCCGRALFNAHYGTIFCKQRSFKTDSDCRDIEINKHDADMAVLASVKREAEIFLDRDKLSRQVIKKFPFIRQ